MLTLETVRYEQDEFVLSADWQSCARGAGCGDWTVWRWQVDASLPHRWFYHASVWTALVGRAGHHRKRAERAACGEFVSGGESLPAFERV